MLQNLSQQIRECYACAQQCKRLAEAALTEAAKANWWPSRLVAMAAEDRLSVRLG
jgi:hypothetical protein